MFAAILFLLLGLMMCGISVPMLQGRVPRNYVYGFRTPKTLKNDHIWYLANAFAGRAMLIAGGVIVLGSLLLLPIGWVFGNSIVATLGTALVLVALGAAVIKSFAYLKRL
jgi:uncharacterized membrane protein